MSLLVKIEVLPWDSPVTGAVLEDHRLSLGTAAGAGPGLTAALRRRFFDVRKAGPRVARCHHASPAPSQGAHIAVCRPTGSQGQPVVRFAAGLSAPVLRPEAGEGAEAAGPKEVQGRPCPLGGGGGRPRCPRWAPSADGAGGNVGAAAPVRAGLAAWRGDLLSARSYKSGHLKEERVKKGTEEEGKVRSKLKEHEKGKNT